MDPTAPERGVIRGMLVLILSGLVVGSLALQILSLL